MGQPRCPKCNKFLDRHGNCTACTTPRMRECANCGNKFETHGTRADYCKDCRSIVKKEYNKIKLRERREREKKQRGSAPFYRNCKKCGKRFRIKAGANNTKNCPDCRNMIDAVCESCGAIYKKSRYATSRKHCDECRDTTRKNYSNIHQSEMAQATEILKEIRKRNRKPPKSISARAAAIDRIRAGVPIENIPEPGQLVAEAHESFCQDNPAQFLNQEQREKFRAWCEKHKMGV